MYGGALESAAVDDDGRHTAKSVAVEASNPELIAFLNAVMDDPARPPVARPAGFTEAAWVRRNESLGYRWPAFLIALGCHRHAEAARLLRLGLIDPRSTSVGGDASVFSREPCTLTRAIEVATGTALLGGVDKPPMCRKTLALARRALKPWSPANHDLCTDVATPVLPRRVDC